MGFGQSGIPFGALCVRREMSRDSRIKTRTSGGVYDAD